MLAEKVRAAAGLGRQGVGCDAEGTPGARRRRRRQGERLNHLAVVDKVHGPLRRPRRRGGSHRHAEADRLAKGARADGQGRRRRRVLDGLGRDLRGALMMKGDSRQDNAAFKHLIDDAKGRAESRTSWFHERVPRDTEGVSRRLKKFVRWTIGPIPTEGFGPLVRLCLAADQGIDADFRSGPGGREVFIAGQYTDRPSGGNWSFCKLPIPP